MRVAGGAFLVAVAMIFFYLITTGKLAAALATFHVLANPGAAGSGASPTANVTPTPQAATPTLASAGLGSNPYGASSWTQPMNVPNLPTLPTLIPATPVQAA